MKLVSVLIYTLFLFLTLGCNQTLRGSNPSAQPPKGIYIAEFKPQGSIIAGSYAWFDLEIRADVPESMQFAFDPQNTLGTAMFTSRSGDEDVVTGSINVSGMPPGPAPTEFSCANLKEVWTVRPQDRIVRAIQVPVPAVTLGKARLDVVILVLSAPLSAPCKHLERQKLRWSGLVDVTEPSRATSNEPQNPM